MYSLRTTIPPNPPGCAVSQCLCHLGHGNASQPLSAALGQANGPLALRQGSSLTTDGHHVIPVSSGIERPCIIMDPPRPLVGQPQTKGHLICLMATFASSGGQYESFGKLLQRFVVPVEPNEQLLPDSDMYALKADPAWRHPRQWAIAFVIHTKQPLRPFTSRDGKSHRLSNTEYDRLVEHCETQRALWISDTRKDENLKQEMYEELVDWTPDDASMYSCHSSVSALSVNSFKSFYAQPCRGSIATLGTIFEDTTPAYPNLGPSDFPPLPSKVCEVY
ncbi:uncharacterized protein BT62DRAFT_930271 [Guyanagaster necrorhizus]|uniref:Uncharacterized protein n=1 Tax=Guyanagaster necrorhizus TaxID=856835 RepID=A0A9P8AUL2_9AGAR|nr:uncharacterized protein BT62DRAFT_930271 [Guyanagaster necrorhizus MCA 3950]KAG7448176.1 hypothetical protein BT62DRAFT_930271 [Guyanagaster necrorhizus MCA 3950]